MQHRVETVEIKLDLVDPSPLQPPSRQNPSAKSVESLAASMRLRGQLDAIIVIENNGRYEVIAGHRRRKAALVNKWTTIIAKVLPSDTPVEQIQTLMDSNDERENPTAAKRSILIQSALDLGIAETDLGISTEEAKAARSVSKAVRAKRGTAKPVLSNPQASLEEAAALVEFGTDAKAIDRLTEVIGSGRFPHVLQQLRSARDRAQRIGDARKSLEDERTLILNSQNTWYRPAVKLSELKIEPEVHRECEGHGAVVDHEGDIVYWCTKGHLHDSKYATGKQGGKTEEQKAHDRAKRQMRARLKDASVVRGEFVNRLLTKYDAGATAWEFTAAEARELGLPSVSSHGLRSSIKDLMPASPSAATTLLVLAIAQVEKSIADHIKFTGGVKDPNERGWDTMVLRFAPYYNFLRSAGYETSEAEAEWLKSGHKVRLERNAKRATVEGPEPVQVGDPS